MLGSLGSRQESSEVSLLRGRLVVVSGLPRWLPKEWWLAENIMRGNGSNPVLCGAET